MSTPVNRRPFDSRVSEIRRSLNLARDPPIVFGAFACSPSDLHMHLSFALVTIRERMLALKCNNYDWLITRGLMATGAWSRPRNDLVPSYVHCVNSRDACGSYHRENSPLRYSTVHRKRVYRECKVSCDRNRVVCSRVSVVCESERRNLRGGAGLGGVGQQRSNHQVNNSFIYLPSISS